MDNKVILAVEKSANKKTGIVSATYAPIQSCPKTCPFLNSGCYGQVSFCGTYLRKLNKAAKILKKERPIDIARIEAMEIKKLKGVLPLRLHVVGDAKTPAAAEILSVAAKEYTSKKDQPVWTYTHAWREIPREKWGNISVLASCETLEECKLAMKRGYAASIVRLKPFTGTMRYDGVKMTACKEIDKGISCNKCKLCFNDKELLKEGKVIAFFPHGSGAQSVKRAIGSKVYVPRKGK